MSMTLDDRIAPPARRAAPRRAASKAAAGPVTWLKRRFRARPGATIAHGLFAAAALAIVVNAVAWQPPGPERGASADQAAIPMPPPRPVELGGARQGTPPVQQAAAPQALPVASARAASPARENPARETPARETGGRDAIGDLIRTGMVPGMDAPRPPAPVIERASLGQPAERAASERSVAAAQRALNKLGFGPVREDGRFGEGTRAALERFERERRIPVTRDLSARTQRELAAASGIRME